MQLNKNEVNFKTTWDNLIKYKWLFITIFLISFFSYTFYFFYIALVYSFGTVLTLPTLNNNAALTNAIADGIQMNNVFPDSLNYRGADQAIIVSYQPPTITINSFGNRVNFYQFKHFINSGLINLNNQLQQLLSNYTLPIPTYNFNLPLQPQDAHLLLLTQKISAELTQKTLLEQALALTMPPQPIANNAINSIASINTALNQNQIYINALNTASTNAALLESKITVTQTLIDSLNSQIVALTQNMIKPLKSSLIITATTPPHIQSIPNQEHTELILPPTQAKILVIGRLLLTFLLSFCFGLVGIFCYDALLKIYKKRSIISGN
ncbi:MAG: hypothetical protein A3E87_05245 [Gammaproteobacteria bacterium RIFCSPHIGHO2_12_FULL_35_23]|nr:MAG: hypothetical protein A3E87_05245 [Gammaproteobacteria bacterium RIFCSPHIGHO2_12_FULL_35_23]